MQPPHRFPVAAKHRNGERRTALCILRFEIRTKLDQQIERAVVLTGSEQAAHEPIGRRNHVVERRLLLLEFRQTSRDRLRVAGDYTSQQIEVSQRDRREHMMVRTAFDEQVDHVTASLFEHSRPPDDIHSMKIANALHIGSAVEQRPHRLERASACGEVERERVITCVSSVGVGAVLEQQSHSVGMMHRDVKTGRARLAFAYEMGLARQQLAKGRDISRAARSEVVVNRCLCRRHGCRL